MKIKKETALRVLRAVLGESIELFEHGGRFSEKCVVHLVKYTSDLRSTVIASYSGANWTEVLGKVYPAYKGLTDDRSPKFKSDYLALLRDTRHNRVNKQGSSSTNL